jgi:glycerate kinase
MPLRVLIAPSGFKESLGADEVAAAIAAGVRRAVPDAEVVEAPLVDGGEGFTRALVRATDGELREEVEVTGPVGAPVAAHFGFLGGTGPRTGVLEMAAAAGLRLVPRDQRDPLATTTRGVGELILAALDAGAERLLVGCGDSGTNDGGAGMAQALGVHLCDGEGGALGPGGSELARLARIDASELDARLRGMPVDVAVNPHNVLCGPRGVAQVFGPQKGASPRAVGWLAGALQRYADVLERDLGVDVRAIPGGGASGGLGAGLHAFLGATLHPRFDVVTRYLDLDGQLASADLVITAEGAIDLQTPRGKIPAEVARRAKRHDLPVVAIAGTVGDDAELVLAAGLDAFTSIIAAPGSLAQAIEDASRLVEDAAATVLRMIALGQHIGTPFEVVRPAAA